MKNINENHSENHVESKNLEISCGNCWGHQQYSQGYREKKFDYWKGKKDNFISRFVKKYIRS